MGLVNVSIVLLPVWVTLFWAVVFFSTSSKNDAARLTLGAFMAFDSLLCLCYAFFYIAPEAYLKIDWLFNLLDLSVYPLFYIYVKILTKERIFKRKNFIYFTPGLLVGGGLFLGSLILSPEQFQQYYTEIMLYQDFSFVKDSIVNYMLTLFFVGRAVFVLQSIIYLVLCYYAIQQYEKGVVDFYSNLKNRKLKWLGNITITLLFIVILGVFVGIVGRSFFAYNDYALLFIPSLFFGILLFYLGIMGNKQYENQIEWEDVALQYTTKGKRGDCLGRDLEREIVEEKLFLNSDLKITDVAKIIGTNRTYISNFINNEYGVNFNQYINQYRAAYAKKLLEAKSDILMSDVAEISGFGSVSCFNRVFKNTFGFTPKEFKNTKR